MNEALRFSEAARKDLRHILKRELPIPESVYADEDAAYEFVIAACTRGELPHMPVLDVLRLPARFGMQADEMLEWLYVLQPKKNAAEFTESRTALTRYLSDRVPPEYVRTISVKRNPVRGHYDICAMYHHEVSAEYAAAADWSFRASDLKSLELGGVPAEYTKALNYMNKTPEWVETFHQARVDGVYAQQLFAAGHGHHRVAEFWAHDVPVEYAAALPSALAVEDITAGYENGIPAEYLLAMHATE